MKHSRKLLLCLLILGLSLSLSCVRVYAQIVSEKASEPVKTDLIAEKAKGSTVRLVRGDFSGFVGSGFLVERDKIATNFLVAAALYGTRPIFATLADKEAIWEVAGVAAFDVESDLLKPDNIAAYIDRAKARADSGDYAGAIEDFTHAIKLKPDNIAAYIDRANARVDLGDYTGAIEDYTHTIKLWPEESNLYINRGVTKIRLDDYSGAIEDFTHAIKLKPDNAAAYNNRGTAKKVLGQHEAAKIDFEKAKEIDLKIGK